MSKNIMVRSTVPELLGETLNKAGLISPAQIDVALTDLNYNPDLRIGEVFALRGWLGQQTADFFADEWHPLLIQSDKYPLGYYLVKSGLLTGEQTYLMLQEQKQLWIKFGSIAILRGLITQETLNFFLDRLFPGTSADPPAIGAKSPQPAEPPTTVEVEPTIEPKTTVEIDYDNIPWID
ncbi:MAG: hypothetical protein AAFQ41_13265 [Cyanobacteria bacterium J06623_7]